MGIQSLYAFNAAVDGLNKTAQDLANIQEARRKREQEKQRFELDKKRADIQLKADELDLQEKARQGEIDASVFPARKQMVMDMFKNMDSVEKGKDAQLDMVEQQTIMKQKQLKDQATNFAKFDPTVSSFLGSIQNNAITYDPISGKFIKNSKVAQVITDESQLGRQDLMAIHSMAKDLLPKDSSGKIVGTPESKYSSAARFLFPNLKKTRWDVAEESAQQIPQPEIANVEQKQPINSGPRFSIRGFLQGATNLKTAGDINKDNARIMQKGQANIDYTRKTGRVKVLDPNGKLGTIPAGQVKSALAEGWKLAE